MISFRYCKEISSGQWYIAKLPESEPGNAGSGSRNRNLPALESDRLRLCLGTVRQRGKGPVERRISFRATRNMINGLPTHPPKPVILAVIQPEHFVTCLQDTDERQEKITLQTIFIKLVRSSVRRRNNNDSHFEHGKEQAGYDHRIGNISNLELIETEQPGAVGKFPGRRTYWLRRFRDLVFLPPLMDQLMGLAHEFVKMHTPLLPDLRAIEKKIHHHGLAAPDRAVNVESFGWI